MSEFGVEGSLISDVPAYKSDQFDNIEDNYVLFKIQDST